MKKSFPGYYRPTAEEFARLWAESLIALDANVLLNIYGYSPETRDTLVALLTRVRERLWMPHQFAAEFHRNRHRAILEQASRYTEIRSKLKKILDDDFRSPRHHPFICAKSLKAFEKLCDELAQGEALHKDMLTKDPYFAQFSDLLEGRVGLPYSDEQLAAVHDDARQRYTRAIPPGYLDAGTKPDIPSFGDYVGWKQLLDHCNTTRCSAILVTDDSKADWWHMQSERRIGPRPELIAEFQTCCGHLFYMYSLEQFLKRSHEYLGQQVTIQVLEEIRLHAAETAASKPPKSAARDVSDLKGVPLFSTSTAKSSATPETLADEASLKPDKPD